MRVPQGEWLVLDEVESTQKVAAQLLGEPGNPHRVILARHQTAGKGRFERTWFSAPGSSLVASIIFDDYSGHSQPWLIGMILAAAAAGAAHCRVRWPNDLVIGGKKLGGILTDMTSDPAHRSVPIIGIGINIGPMKFPAELAPKATTLAEHMNQIPEAADLLAEILARAAGMPEPSEWADIQPIWDLYDDTAGKRYVTASGREAVALGIGSRGELIASANGESMSIMAGEAIFGAT